MPPGSPLFPLQAPQPTWQQELVLEGAEMHLVSLAPQRRVLRVCANYAGGKTDIYPLE